MSENIERKNERALLVRGPLGRFFWDITKKMLIPKLGRLKGGSNSISTVVIP